MTPSAAPPGKTAADYLAIAVGPVLIMLMVGSLVFYLIEIGYRGSFTPQVYWTLFWFTVASVLVSRISIEQGSSYAGLYGLALGAATALRLVEFLGAPLGALLLLALIWWCAAKLTWDCTLIDETADASGQGLLQQAGLSTEAADPADSADSADPAGTPESHPPAPGPTYAPALAPVAPPKRPHAPGRWILYFSLAALPAFGFGQWLIPLSDAGARLRGFVLATLFVTTAFALLLTTSFLGLRRYLRQRHLVMPPPMARSWMILGSAMLGAVLLTALLLPRPRGPDTLAHLGLGFRSKPQRASSHAWLPGEDAAPGQGRALGRQPARDASPPKPGDSPAGPKAGGSTPGDPNRAGDPAASRSGGAGRDGNQPGTTGGGQEDSDSGKGGQDTGADRNAGTQGSDGSGSASGGDSASPPGLDAPGVPPEALSLLRWLTYAFGAVVAGYLLVRFGRQALAALRHSWRTRKKAGPRPADRPTPRRPAFANFADPFANGRAETMTPAQVTAYTFEALQAWAADSGRERRPEQTPVEFGDALIRSVPEWSDLLRGTVRLYVGVAYGGLQPAPASLEILRRLWSVIRSR